MFLKTIRNIITQDNFLNQMSFVIPISKILESLIENQ